MVCCPIVSKTDYRFSDFSTNPSAIRSSVFPTVFPKGVRLLTYIYLSFHDFC